MSRSRNNGNSPDEHDEEIADLVPFATKSCLEPRKTLGLFTTTFRAILDAEDLQEHIQSVKKALYHRDYLLAFDTDDKRLAYAARWTPARTLAYASLFSSFAPIRELFSDPERTSRCLSIGGGAGAEVAGLASVFCRLKEFHSTSPSSLEITAIDIADWSLIVRSLTTYIKSNWVYDASKVSTSFLHGDVLSTPVDYSQFDLITLMFTTNELFSEKRPETIKLLQTLNKTCRKGTILLIAESAGSYSNITVGTKQFPVQFLVDMVLVGKPGGPAGAWSIAQQSESCWYRINTREVSYPMKLENMRFFYRLYIKN
ncbi:25S rRNA (uridine(2843)-N(3))-methyltransferase [[Candida] anglica]|uniref:25S rRNA (Uridine(2843)-N(3))-methyltransferase n=1 Tax=[Candida] anglica TaxID=148631 RepID=A0ABP0EM79_9ASCO